MIQDMSTVRIAETELPRDVHAVMEKVQQGIEVIVEQDHRPVAVIRASQPAGRKISEVIAALEASRDNAVLERGLCTGRGRRHPILS